MRAPSAVFAIAAAVSACDAKHATTPPPSSLVDVATLAPVRAAFDAHRGEPRFIALLSPTWTACVRGARAVRSAIVDDPRVARLRPIIAWIPMLDDDERASAVAMTATFADPAIPQFWDGHHVLGEAVATSLGLDDRAAWDVYLFYPPDAEWTDRGVPPPAKVIAQAGGVVVGAKGTLPAKGDPSRVPAWARDRAVVVGEQSELADLLSAIAVPFVAAR